MHKNKWSAIRDFIVKNCKIVFPILLVAIVAVTVVIALNANKEKQEAEVAQAEESYVQESQMAESEPVTEEVPLTANTDEEIYAFVETYYNAKSLGDTETLVSVCETISENDLLYYEELSKYIDYYSNLEVYSKQGPTEGSVIAYVYFKMGIINFQEVPGYETLYICRNEDGNLYIKNENNLTDEEKAYIKTVNEQVDVVEFNNRVNVEYNELMSENPDLLEYLGLLGTQVKAAVGEILAAQNAETVPEQTNIETAGEQGGDAVVQTSAEVAPADAGPMYATATTTVNVRSSDSENADKLGKVTGGSRVQVQEVRVNGWTKIVYEGKDGYIKSEYLLMEESAANLETIGSITANTTVNVRSAANETAERLGVLAGGESLSLLAVENGWCKVNYNGQVGYVKSDYVTQQ
ncbi:MAG: SH3 domain-containing protein [Lachnospiraceae bacterium]|nr:SH3 domain-containing protein [Lachnospiraceae bacterium]